MKTIMKLAAALAIAGFATNASAVLVGTAGTIDDLLASASLHPSSAGNEESWIETVLGFDITYTQLSDDVSDASNWEAVTDGSAGDYALDFGAGVTPLYFLVKTGGGRGAGTTATHFLYSNNDSMQWAYVNLANFGNVSLSNIGVISHAGISGGGSVSVPEPATLSLLGAGLLAAGFARRRKRTTV